MILPDREIILALTDKQIEIDPSPSANALSSTSIDLTLGDEIRVWNETTGPGVEAPVISPSTPGYDVLSVIKEHSIPRHLPDEGLIFEPKSFLLAWTLEEVRLPHTSRIAARVEGKSSLARLGIAIHVTAPTIHAGFQGRIQLELCNHGSLRVRLRKGMPICQLIFEQVFGTPEKGYSGQFLKQ